MKSDWIRRLAERTGFPKISLYLPMEVRGAETQQNPIRLKNALTRARDLLEEAGVGGRTIKQLTDEAEARIEDFDFWQHQDQALAVLIDASGIDWIKLPGEVEELVLIGERFHLRPLIRIFADPGTGHLLCVTRDFARLYDLTRHDIRPVEVKGMPDGYDKFRGMSEFEGNVGFHANAAGSSARGGGASGVPQYHSLGPSPDEQAEAEFDSYLGEVARAVDRHLAGRAQPLMLAAEPRTLGHLAAKLHYREVAAEHLNVDPASKRETQLHEAAWPMLERHVDSGRAEALERLRARLGDANAEGAMRDIDAIARAAVEGRLEAVFIARGAHLWGRYDGDRHRTELLEREAPGAGDLIDFVAVSALNAGGAVYSLDGETAEEIGPVAALARY
ncbi:baeRF3 domain-containing protein [Afifella pfennigii]|uniref:baeRF3 domain-containing protein n=1 Tax=Afifella pfennigii TaxID=209897 RepID=UPI0004791269|nr:hypothetical protein [Afifella pfennigii]